MLYPGSVAGATLELDLYDATTAAAVAVHDPAGATILPSATTGDGGRTWTTTPVVYTTAGWWVWVWTVTGTGARLVPQPVYVATSPQAGGPLWTPTREQVADYVPGRTLSRDLTGARRTFDTVTDPTGEQVDRLIGDAVAWVQVRVGADPGVAADLCQFAASVAAVYTAAMVERGYPTRTDDVSTAQALWAQATAMRDDLARANEALTGVDPDDPGAGLLPIGSFPPPPLAGCGLEWLWRNSDMPAWSGRDW